MASKSYPASVGYFNKKMLTILESEEKKTASKKPAKKTSTKKNK